ncbi:MAG: endo alpha-1,4 polygalactosaminidase [Spirochaetales bacterium]|nr:endo alpha-1,4 polygalactosaminidase [Spirochaetales bacterium]
MNKLICIFLIVSPMLFSENLDYRQEMRDLIIDLRVYADSQIEDFIIIPQNGQELVTSDGETIGIVQRSYLASINGTGREDLFFGYDTDDQQTPDRDWQYLFDLCRLFEENGVEVLVTDYCWTGSNVDSSYLKNAQAGFISFAAGRRELDAIPLYPSVPFNVNSRDIRNLPDARNFLYLLNSEGFSNQKAFIDAVSATDYDLLIIDLFYDGMPLKPDDVERLSRKSNGGRRLVLCYMSIGEAEDYRYYWKNSWARSRPDWIDAENPYWEGNYKVKYWDKSWQDIIFGNSGSYLKKIIDAGFDGVYLDIIDAFEYYEE